MIWRDSVTFADELKRLPLTRVNAIFGPKVALPEGFVLHGCSITTKVVDAISKVKRDRNDRPLEKVVIKKVTFS